MAVEIIQPGQQPAHCQGHVHTDAERALLRGDPVFEGLEVFKDVPRTGEHLFAFGCQLQAAAGPDEHRGAVVTLQLLDFAAHGALCQAQRLCRLGDAD
ncbi:hypothetical protein D3C75_870900 [compost metagenome]